MAKKKIKQEPGKQNAVAFLIIGAVIVAAVAGFIVYQKVTFDPYNFAKVKAPKYVFGFLQNDKRSPAEEITDAALYVAVSEKDRSPILIGDEDQKAFSKISEMYTQLGLASKADWTAAYRDFSPQGIVRPESAGLADDSGVLTIGGGKDNPSPKKVALDAGADLQQILAANGQNPDVLVQVADAYNQRGDKAKAKDVLDQTVKQMADEKDIFVLKRVMSEVVMGYVKAGEAEAAIDVYVKNNFFLGAGITLDMLREWVNQKDLNHAFFLFERMLYSPWQRAEALLILAQGYQQSGAAELQEDHGRVISEVIEDTREPKKEPKQN